MLRTDRNAAHSTATSSSVLSTLMVTLTQFGVAISGNARSSAASDTSRIRP